MTYTILGAGISGISIADHLAKRGIPYQLYEAKPYAGGHIHSEKRDGFMWDEGPHLSFTKHPYVKDYLSSSCDSAIREFSPEPVNYLDTSWIPHPAQTNMYAVPEPLKQESIEGVLEARKDDPIVEPDNYQEWLNYAFGKAFSEKLPEVYTKKYWTTGAENLSTDWIGNRVYFPELSDMLCSADGPLTKHTHYISTVRYPEKGGFYSFMRKVANELNINFNKTFDKISFADKRIHFRDGSQIHYDKLISTIPLPVLISKSDAPEHIVAQSRKLNCSQVLLVNVIASHPAKRPNEWIYVYDESFYSTRINFTELLSKENGQPGSTGIQVEVYFSDYKPLTIPAEEVEQAVIRELVQMGLVESEDHVTAYHSKWIEWANVIFDQQRRAAQQDVLNWLSSQGLKREADDLEPMTDWNTVENKELGSLILAGRFAQWKYFWTDDCIMRSKYVSDNIGYAAEEGQSVNRQEKNNDEN